MSQRLTERSERGQTLVIVALGMVALVAMVGVVIDVGFLWASNRDSQNGSDAVAHAGAVVIMEDLSGDPGRMPTWRTGHRDGWRERRHA